MRRAGTGSLGDVVIYRVGQKSVATNSRPYFCEILTDKKNSLENAWVNLQLNEY